MSEQTRALIVEDYAPDRSWMKRVAEGPEYRDKLSFRFWNEGPGEPFDVQVLQQFLEGNQSEFDVLVLDHCWTAAEDHLIGTEEMRHKTVEEIVKLPDEQCPGAVRLLRRLKETGRLRIPVLILTGHGYKNWSEYVQDELEMADWTMSKDRTGEKLEELAEQVINIHRVSLKQQRAELDRFKGNSPSIKALRRRMEEVLRSGSGHVFITGPTGSGKELVAEILGKALAGAGPYVPFLAAAIPEALVAAELFGCVKDYPNAGSPQRLGAFKEAEGGVLFLDEIADFPPECQGVLLRAFAGDGREPVEIQVVGGGPPTRINVRLIVATDMDLEKNAKEGKIRSQFKARIDQFLRIDVPGLNHRREDIPDLVKLFLRDATVMHNTRYGIRISSEAMECLKAADWSSANARGLRACINELVASTRSNEIGVEEVEAVLRLKYSALSSKPEVKVPGNYKTLHVPEVDDKGLDLLQLEEQVLIRFLTPILQDALRLCDGKQAKVALLLRISTDQLRDRISKCKLDPKDFKSR